MHPVNEPLLPNAFILGAQKAGTTWLAKLLSAHPDVDLGLTKEAHCFNREERASDFEQFYSRHFEGSTAKVRLDATPNYLCDPDVPNKLAAACPDATLILSLRNPVDRVVSALSHGVAQGWFPMGVHSSDYVGRLLDGEDDERLILSFSDYLPALRKWLELFPRDRFQFLVFEEDVSDTQVQTLERSMDHLSLDREAFDWDESKFRSPNPTPKSSVGSYLARYLPGGGRLAAVVDRVSPASNSLRSVDERRLVEHFAADRAEIEKILGRSLSHWQS